MLNLDINTIIQSEVELHEGIANVRKKYLDAGLIDPSAFEDISATDPTPQKKYVDWIFKQVFRDYAKNGKIIFIGNNLSYLVHWLNHNIKIFNDGLNRNMIDNRDINQYKNFDQLSATVEEIKQKTEIKKKEQEYRWDLADKIYEDKKYLIVSPNSYEGAKYWGVSTKWCITYSDDNSYWNNYFFNKQLKFYFIIDKRKDPRTTPTGKIAFGVDENDEVAESFDAQDREIDSNMVKTWMAMDGVPVNDIFVHDGWEEQAENNYSRAIEDINSKLEALRNSYSLKHADAHFSIIDDYDVYVTPESFFDINIVFVITIPDTYKLIKPLDEISRGSLETIKLKIEECDGGNVEDMYVRDDRTILAYIYFERIRDIEDDYTYALNNAENLDKNYDNILSTTLKVLTKDKIIHVPELDEYYRIFDEIEDAVDNDKPFRKFKHFEFGVYPDEGGIFCNIEAQDRNLLATSKFTIKFGRSFLDANKIKQIIQSELINTMLDTEIGKEEYYDPKQLIFKDILGSKDPEYERKTQSTKTTVKNILQDSNIDLQFRNYGPYRESKENYYELYMTLKFPAPSDMNAIITQFQKMDLDYYSFMQKFVAAINKEFNNHSAELQIGTNPLKYIGTPKNNLDEDFNGLIDKYLSRIIS